MKDVQKKKTNRIYNYVYAGLVFYSKYDVEENVEFDQNGKMFFIENYSLFRLNYKLYL